MTSTHIDHVKMCICSSPKTTGITKKLFKSIFLNNVHKQIQAFSMHHSEEMINSHSNRLNNLCRMTERNTMAVLLLKQFYALHQEYQSYCLQLSTHPTTNNIHPPT